MKLLNHLRKFLYSKRWEIGFCEEGLNGVFSVHPRYRWVKNPYVKEKWFADPFILDVTADKIFLLVEEMRYAKYKGRIAKLTIDRESLEIEKVDILLEESTHLSFPNILRKDGKIYVYPENAESGELKLYSLETNSNGKEQLVYVKTICKERLADAVITNKFGSLMMFATKEPFVNGNKLCRYDISPSMDALDERTILFSDKHARMAGQFFEYNGSVYRPSQDCNKVYGGGVVIEQCTLQDEMLLFEKVKTLYSTHRYLKEGMHTLNEYKGLVVVDVKGYNYFIGRIFGWMIYVKKNIKCKIQSFHI